MTLCATMIGTVRCIGTEPVSRQGSPNRWNRRRGSRRSDYAVGDIMLNADVFLAAAQQDDEIEVEDDDAPLKDDERDVAAADIAIWLLEHAVKITAEYPTGTNFVPVAIDDDTQRISVIVEAPGVSNSLTEIPMPAAA